VEANTDQPEFYILPGGDAPAIVSGLLSCGRRLEESRANAALLAAAPDLREALQRLYDETADYIRINKLGDVHHNRSMQMARDALDKTPHSQRDNLKEKT
jgi:hypothetical protein